MRFFRRRPRPSIEERTPPSAAELMTAAETLRRTVKELSDGGVLIISLEAAKALAFLLELEETYLVGSDYFEKTAHVQAALRVARAINADNPQE